MTNNQENGWLDAAHNWIQSVFAEQNLAITGEIEAIHIRPWSSILRIPSESKFYYFKATDGLSAHEIPVTTYLSRLESSHTPVVLAVHPEKSWLIMQDAGQRLRETLIANADWTHWETLLPQYAKVQQSASKSPEKLLACGLPNRSLAELSRLFADSLEVTELYRIDEEGGLSSGEYERLVALSPIIQQKMATLATYAIPETVHHGDLHDGNIFHNGDTYAFYDWGDSSFSHPFISLRTAYVSAEIRFGLDEGAPELQRLRDAYLPAWGDYASAEDLLATFTLAEELWTIPTALNWQAQILATEGEARAEFAHIMPSIGQEILGMIKA